MFGLIWGKYAMKVFYVSLKTGLRVEIYINKFRLVYTNVVCRLVALLRRK